MMFLDQSHTDMMEGLLELNSALPLFWFHSLWALGATVVHISALSGLYGGWVLLLPWLPSVFPLPWGMVPEMPFHYSLKTQHHLLREVFGWPLQTTSSPPPTFFFSF